MNSSLRSKHGCWTCRLRKKKCDERRPQCETCASLSITCHGFGPRPEWMDSNEKRRAVASNLAEMTRSQVSSRKTVSRPAREPSTHLPQLAPKPKDAGLPLVVSLLRDQTLANPEPIVSHSQTVDNGATNALKVNPQAGDYSLIMNFIDSVFPLQLPLYKPDAATGGRGWLLSLLFRTKALYHAVLALGAYHRSTVMSPQGSSEWHTEDKKFQEEHLAICLDIVHESTSGACCKDGSGVGIAAAITQLLFFEASFFPSCYVCWTNDLFTNHNNNGWQAHLRVLVRLFKHVYTRDLVNIGLSDQSRLILMGREELKNHSPGVTEDVMGFRTIAGSIVWLDILFSITTGDAPSSWPDPLFSNDSACQVRLQDIMGCQNWIMIQIGRIADFHKQMTQATEHKCEEYMQTVQAIHNDIQRGLANLGSPDLMGSCSPLIDINSPGHDPVVLITYLYTQTALIYLHLILHGFKDFQHVRAPIAIITSYVRRGIKPELHPALVLPFFICGSVVDEGDRGLFRSVLSGPLLLTPCLQHRPKVLRALGEIWSQRQSMPAYTWHDCLISSSDILLH
ncbi:unnamed protein product [Clonostachys rosea]|uniref:Zn(2)-C6 fungal-type domain-containing protein n=1 Tax=Bionectria ochroleuca TaxID=29856 RepID=A0ABY6UIS3_BIOOC|nr:unnamed protein product [Clonostachys rosea]